MNEVFSTIFVSLLVGLSQANEQHDRCQNSANNCAVLCQVAARTVLGRVRFQLGRRVQPDGFPRTSLHHRFVRKVVHRVCAAVIHVARLVYVFHLLVSRRQPIYTYLARKCVLHGIGAFVSDMRNIPEYMGGREDRSIRLSHECVPSRVVP